MSTLLVTGLVTEWVKIIGVVGALVGLLVGVQWLGQRWRWSPERQRKTLHVALGLTALSFPWLFIAHWPVWTICGSGLLILLALRHVPVLRRRLGGTLHGVGRESTGELLFAVAIALLYWLAPSATEYVVPLAILTVADTAAALVGVRWGRRCFAVPDGRKSWEGVASFGGTALLVAVPLLALLTDRSWPALFLIALTVVILTTLTEAIAWQGQDNLLVPLAGFLTLQLTLTQPTVLLLYQLLAFGGISLLLQPAWSLLQPHTTLVTIFVVAVYWWGGVLLWLLALVTFLLMHLVAHSQEQRENWRRLDAIPLQYWLVPVG